METVELLELLLSPNNKRSAALRASLAKFKLPEIACMHPKEVQYLFSLTAREALSLKLIIELARRFQGETRQQQPTIQSPEDIADLLMPEMRHLDREHLRVVCLDTKNKIIRIAPVSVGILNSSLAHPREFYKTGIMLGASALIAVHNHPSGDPTPSAEDIQLTKHLQRSGELVGIDLLDHIIIGDGSFASL